MLNQFKSEIMYRKRKHTYIVKRNAVLFTLFFAISFFNFAFSQEAKTPKVYKSRIKIEYLKKGDNSKEIKATISSRINKKPVKIKNVSLSLYDLTDSTKFIEDVVTNSKGIALFSLPVDYPIGRDTSGAVFNIKFDGNPQFKPSSKKIEIKDAIMTTSFETIDSVYTVTVSAYEMENGELGEPLTDLDVYVYVQRMFSLLKVSEGWLQNGEAIIEIPDDLPGDSENNLKLIIRIPETEEFGSIEGEKTINWGRPMPKDDSYSTEKQRALWEPMAPLWMVITLGLLIVAVFYHYILIIYKLFKIKKLGKIKPA